MAPLAPPRLLMWVTCAFFFFSLTTTALPASAAVLISVNKSTQQMAMPHSIFFHGGYAIHGSYEINRLGGPASHGCIRLHPANAAPGSHI